MRIKLKYITLWFMVLLLFVSPVYAERQQNFNNTAPVSNFTVEKSRNVKILVFSDYAGTAITNLKNAIGSMKSGLANDAKITVEYANPSTVTLGTQQGKYKENTWGMMGHYKFTWSGVENGITYSNKAADGSFSFSPSVVLPEGKTPNTSYSVPTSCSYNVKRTDGMFGGSKNREYSFYSNNGLCYGSTSLWIEYSFSVGSGGAVSGTRDFDTEPTFEYDNFWSIYSSSERDVTNTVTGWDLSKVNYNITDGTDTYIIFAMNNEDTNYYHESENYSLGQLRKDSSLGKYATDSNARVYSICSDSFENVNLSTNAAYPVTFNAAAQNISLRDLISMSYDGRSLGKNNVSSLVKNIRENIKKPTGSVDMLIATDENTDQTNSFINNVKNAVSDDVSLQTSVVNKTDTLYSWDKPTFSSKLRVFKQYQSYDITSYFILTPSGELWGIQESYHSSFGYYGLNNTAFIKMADNVKDLTIDSYYKSLSILKYDGTIWELDSYTGELKKLEGLNDIIKMQVEVQCDVNGYRSVLRIALDKYGYLWHLGTSNFEGDLYDTWNVPAKMKFSTNGTIVDFNMPAEAYGDRGSDYKLTVARTNNEVWEIHSGYVYDPATRDYVKAPNVYIGPYNNQPLSGVSGQSAVHVAVSDVPCNIDANEQITDVIKLDGYIYSRYIGVDIKSQIHIFGGMERYNFFKRQDIITNTDMNSVIDVVTVPVKGFSKSSIMKTPLREGSERYFVYISDSIGSDTSKVDFFPFSNLDTEVINYLKENNFNIYVICPSLAYDLKLEYPYVPRTLQMNTLRDLINAGNLDSAFFGGTDNIQKIIEAKYSTFVKQGSRVLTLISGEDAISYDLVYNDVENDPKYSERWQYTHLDSYFDNDNGIADYSGKWLTTPLNSFTKVGKYTVVCQFRDNPKDNNQFDNYRLWSKTSNPATVIVHRRPYALFNTLVTNKLGNSVYLSYLDQSYDLDHNVSRADKGIAARSWQYKKSTSSSWIDGRPASLTYNSGIYQIKLNVKDIEGAWSKAYIDTIDTSNLPPTINATPGEYDGYDKADITITASDNGEDDFAYMRYAVTTSTTVPASSSTQWVKVSNGVKAKDITINTEGTYYLHLEAYDSIGQIGKNMTGPYIIKTLQISNVSITGYWNHWRGQTDIFGKVMTNEPHRFLSLEKVKINVKTIGNPNSVSVRFSPMLEAMQYTDPNGNVYDYKEDFFHYYVNFPLMLNTSDNTNWNVEYALPLAPSSKGWDDVRKGTPYMMTVTAKKGTIVKTYTVGDIDITGNTYDLTYIQPR